MANMRVSFHLRTICALKGVKFSLQKDLISCLLSLFDLEGCADMRIKHLSGGNRRKIKFISALIGRPKYLLLDEPTLGVDIMAQKYFGLVLKFLTEECKVSCIYITHELDEVQRYCSKIGIMKKGGLVLSDSTNNLIKRYSRGVQINLKSNNLNAIKKEVNSAF
jgi:ABC-2 type transport system ATP-binding protein